MPRICLLSDTHSLIDQTIIKHVKTCDEVWHAGDIGSVEVIDTLRECKPLKAVYGNIDDHQIRADVPRFQSFVCDDVKVLITHIGGYPDRYAPGIKKMLVENKVDLFISGHSHILKVMYDKKLELLHINPGAIGKKGFHKVRTLVKFSINGSDISDLEIVELQR